jgi:hypothetical protein
VVATLTSLTLGLYGGAYAFAQDGDAMASASLTGAEEVPGPGDPDGSGTATITFKTGEICWDIDVEAITLPAAAAHIHVGEKGVKGDVVVPLSAPDANGHSEGCTDVDDATRTAIHEDLAGHYVNVHTSDVPDGALRGQLVAVPDTAMGESGLPLGSSNGAAFLLLLVAGAAGTAFAARRFATVRNR